MGDLSTGRPRDDSEDPTPQEAANEHTSLLSRSSPPRPHHNLAGLSATRFRIILCVIWLLTFLASLDATLVATLLTPIGSSFNVSNQAQWLGTSYLLSICCFTPVYGRLSDVIGRRSAQLIATSFFAFGTTCCVFAPSMNTLIAARCVAGIGGGGIASVGGIIVTDLVDLRRRGLFQGYGNIFFALGGALGGPFGGFMSDRFGWRSAFGAQLPFLFLGVCLICTQVKIPSNLKSGADRSLKRVDILGCIALVFAVGSILLGISIKTSSTRADGSDYAWTHPLILGLLVLSVISLAVFIFVEERVAIEPVLPLRFLTRRTPLAISLSSLVMVINQFSIMYNIPLFFSTVFLTSSSKAGAHLLSYSLFLMFGSLLSGWIMRRTGKYWWNIIINSTFMVLSSGMLCFWNRRAPGWLFWVAQSPSGFGYGAVLTSSLVALMTDVVRQGKGETAMATSISYMFRTIGQVLGVSLSAALVQAVITKDLNRTILAPNKDEVSLRRCSTLVGVADINV